MINFSKVTQASDYNTRHLSHNDYYEEGCRVEGYWFGEGAESLGLSGAQDQDHWKSICANKHPFTAEKLTARSPKIQAFDFIVSAPKAVSILAMTGGDSRLVEDHQVASQLAIKELERFAVRRLREGVHFDSEDVVRCGNIIPADFRLFDHGYCLTSHGSQGKKAQVSVSVMGEAGLRSAKAREVYVAHSRFREKIAVFTTNPEKAREVFQKAGQRLLAKEVRQQAESKALAIARAEARQFLTRKQKEHSYGTQNTRGIRTATGTESRRTNPTEDRTQERDSCNRRPETVVSGGELRSSTGPDRQDVDLAGEQARTAALRRRERDRQRTSRSFRTKLGHGYRH